MIVELEKLKSMLIHKDKQNLKISARGVDWHIDHSLRVIISICRILKKSDLKKYKKNINIPRSILFRVGWMPRGRAKAPDAVNTTGQIDMEAVHLNFEKANQELSEINHLPPNSHFKHFVFGRLNLKEAKRFIELHTRHHLKIMEDIIRSLEV